VIARCRFLLRLIWGVGVWLTVARAQTPLAAPALTPEMTALAATLPAWSATASVETGFGYKDNLLLSHAGEEGSGFARGGVNAIASHLRLGERTDYSFGLTAEGTRYFSNTSVDHEAKAFAVAKWRYHAEEKFKFTFDVQGYYQDQVFDVSDTDAQRIVAQLKVAGAIVGPTVRWAPVSWLWIEARAVGKRASYQDSDFNHDVGDGTLRVGWRPGARFELSLAGMERSRDYDSHPQYSVSGRALTGTHLKITEHETELRADVTWDAAGHWKTSTYGGSRDFHDNGSGYMNYRERKFAQEFDWAAGDWSVHAEGEAKHLLYDVQTVGLGLDPPRRVKEEFSAQLRVERKLNERWTIFAEYNWERNRCNDPIASYNMNEGLLGARWTWEK
jgi:hypothetical protein